MRRFVLVAMLVAACVGAAPKAHAQFCPGVSPWVFDDVLATDPFCGFITRIANQGVTLGCLVIDANHRLFCPHDSTSREQMAAFLSRMGDALLPPTCAIGQVLKWDGGQWACANDNAGAGGTVTSVAAGTGLSASPNPIMGSGSIGLAAGYQLPQGCANGEVAKSNGSGGWTCAIDAGGAGTVTSVTAGTGLAGGVITGVGTISADTNYLQRRGFGLGCPVGATIQSIDVNGIVVCHLDGPYNAYVEGGNAFGTTAVLGTTDNNALDVRVNGVRALRLEPTSKGANFIGGASDNFVAFTAGAATIAGGRNNRAGEDYSTVGGGIGNEARFIYSTVAGGAANTADYDYSTVGGGQFNTAGGNLSTVAGGLSNHAAGAGSFVGGGGNNTASGGNSVIAGGAQNVADGNYSFATGLFVSAAGDTSVALGRKAKALHDGDFVFADNNDFDFAANVANNFRVRATGGVRFVVDIDGSGNTTWSCGLVAGGSWVCSSDRNQKQHLDLLDGRVVLDKLASMPVYAWNPKGRNAHVRHYGPTAQDFYATFGLGDTDLGIGQQDADGVALAAIQGLNVKVEAALEERDARIEVQAREIAALKGLVDVLLARMPGVAPLAAR